MAKSTSEFFWPSGQTDSEARIPFPKLASDSASTIISPLTLPRGVSGYFDHVPIPGCAPNKFVPTIHTSNGAGRQKPRGGQIYSPLSPGIRGLAPPAPSARSPYNLPAVKARQSKVEQYRSSVLSPRTQDVVASPNGAGAALRSPAVGAMPTNGLNPVADMAIPPICSVSTGHPRSVSADATNAPSHVQMIQRLAQQNARMREAWEAERKYLEANRERAEEVYKEERALMEEERAEWEEEKARLLDEIHWLRLQILAMGRGTPPVIKGFHPLSRTFSSECHVRGGTGELSRSSTQSSESSQGTAQPATQAEEAGSALGAPTSDFLKPPTETGAEEGPVEVIDIKEIDPELEGVPLKATTVKKATFTDVGAPRGSGTPSPAGSPPRDAEQFKGKKKKAQTLQVLAAEEADRLIMHAGHTPSHSLSSLGTVTASSGTATPGSNGGDSTPTVPQGGAFSYDVAAAREIDHPSEAPHSNGASPKAAERHDQPTDDHPEATFEPSEDRPLKGPLMVRNMPIHDEAFFKTLNQKLEQVSKDDHAALPAVLQGSRPEDDVDKSDEPRKAGAGEAGSGYHQEESHRSDSTKEDTASISSASGRGSSGARSEPEVESGLDFDVPLKLKKTLNFGLPFGEAPKPSRSGGDSPK
ncbi:hypothetical protein VTI74DRAFT_1048 [Chaetomium olivicolor]